MQGYFSYKLTGSKNDIQLAISKLEKMSQDDPDIKQLLEWRNSKDPEKNVFPDDDYVFIMELPSSGNINSFTFEFDSMAYTLAETFPELALYSTGYLLDFEPYPVWTSEPGSSDIVEDFQSVSMSVELEEGQTVAEIECPVCNDNIKLDVKDEIDKIEEDDMCIYKSICCDQCGFGIELEVYR